MVLQKAFFCAKPFTFCVRSAVACASMYNGRDNGGGRIQKEHRRRDPRMGKGGRGGYWAGGGHRRGRGGGRRGGRRSREQKENPNKVNLSKIQPSLLWYFEMMHGLIAQELAEEQKQINERLANWPLGRLIREGVALVDVVGKRHGRLFDDMIVRFYMAHGGEMPFHRFMQGDIVTVCRQNPLRETPVEGVVYSRSRYFLAVVFSNFPDSPSRGQWRLDKGTNKVAYERMRNALAHFTGYCCFVPSWLQPLMLPTALWIPEQEARSGLPQPEQVITAARTCQLAGQPPAVIPLDSVVSDMTQAPDEWGVTATMNMLRNEATDPQTGEASLNASQMEAVQQGLVSSMSLIQGPPGTGKTWTAVHLIKAWRNLHRDAGPVLATAQSNVAVDQLLTGCVKLGLRAVRIGQPVRVSSDLRNTTLDALLEQHPETQELEAYKAQLQEIRENMHSFRGRDRGMAHRDLGAGSKRIKEWTIRISQDIVGKADVVCATCIGAGTEQLDGNVFRMVVVDEATQCSEPEAIVPLTKCERNGQVVLIGDHQQLPPTVISPEEESQRVLGSSLFQRIAAMKQAIQEHRGEQSTGISSALDSALSISKAGALSAASFVDPLFNYVHTTMLKVQYRMHPAICEWPSGMFYNGKLTAGVAASNRVAPPGLPWPTDLQNGHNLNDPFAEKAMVPILFVALMHGEERTVGESRSKVNDAEVKVVCQILLRVLNAKSIGNSGPVMLQDIGIITPYLGQVRAISDALRELNITVATGSEEETGRKGVEVKSVDGYQGREKELIILSTVRSNTRGEVGFLSDYRRLNVAITRAKRGLVIVGNPSTLCHDPLWASWLKFLNERRLCVHAEGLF